MILGLNTNTSDGLLHKVDPRVKIAGCVLLVGAALKASTGMALAPIIALALIAWGTSGRSLRAGLREQLYFLIFYVITFLLHVILVNDAPRWHLPLGIAVSRAGVERGAFFSVKIFSMICLSGSLLSTTHPTEWQRAGEAFVPKGRFNNRSFQRLAFMMGMAIRFLPLIFAEAQRIQWAQKGRGWKLSGGLVSRVKSLTPIVLPL
ncbi:MAG: energy-coupling factor transporter transmembrane component T, partial [Calditrichota bacterium]